MAHGCQPHHPPPYIRWHAPARCRGSLGSLGSAQCIIVGYNSTMWLPHAGTPGCGWPRTEATRRRCGSACDSWTLWAASAKSSPLTKNSQVRISPLCGLRFSPRWPRSAGFPRAKWLVSGCCTHSRLSSHLFSAIPPPQWPGGDWGFRYPVLPVKTEIKTRMTTRPLTSGV